MYIVFFSTNIDTVSEWKERHGIELFDACYEIEALQNTLKMQEDFILVADYDTVANDINRLIASNSLPKYSVVLERAPELLTGKMLISHGVKAYGNSRMLTHHYSQLIKTVLEGKIWTYPELTAFMAKSKNESLMSRDAKEMIEKRLSDKEIEVVTHILQGLTNEAIAQVLNITTRTVKAHVGSIFTKLHVNDRLSLVLLLK